jgi:hypothetical protein
MYVCKREATIEELLADPIMESVLLRYQTTADEVRQMMPVVAMRRAAARAEGQYRAISEV